MIKFKENKGFTVVELLVAVGLFTTIITIAIGAYIRVLKTQSFMTNVMSANDNVSLVLEQMAREIRTGDDMPGNGYSGNSIRFRNDEGVCVNYELNEETITRATVEIPGSCQDAVYGASEVLTSGNSLIEGLDFNVIGNSGVFGSIERIQIDVVVNIIDPVTGEIFFSDGGNTLRTFVSTRKYFGG